MSQKQLKLKVIIHTFGISQIPSYISHCMSPRDMGVIKESCGLERICGHVYVHFEANLAFTRNEQVGCSEAFRGKPNGAKHPRNVTSHFDTPRNISGEYMTRPGVVKNVPKTTKIEGCYTRF